MPPPSSRVLETTANDIPTNTRMTVYGSFARIERNRAMKTIPKNPVIKSSTEAKAGLFVCFLLEYVTVRMSLQCKVTRNLLLNK